MNTSGHFVADSGQTVIGPTEPAHCVAKSSVVTHVVMVAGHFVSSFGQIVAICGQMVSMPWPLVQTVGSVEHLVTRFGQAVSVAGHCVSSAEQTVQLSSLHWVIGRGHRVTCSGHSVLTVGHEVCVAGQIVSFTGHTVKAVDWAEQIVSITGQTVRSIGHFVRSAVAHRVGVLLPSGHWVMLPTSEHLVGSIGQLVSMRGHSVSDSG